MTIEGLAFVKSTLEKAGIPYCFGVWSEEVTYPYFVGDYAETEPLYEYGESESSFILTGTARADDSILQLEKYKEKIREVFTSEGLVEVLPNGCGIAVMYCNSKPIPTDTDDLKRIEINLKIKEWRVN